MNADESQQQLLLNSSEHITITEETPLTDAQPDGEEGITSAIPEILDWNTSMVSQMCRDGDIPRLRLFVEYSQQTLSCGKNAAEIADRLDVDTGLSPLHHAARYQQLDICLILLSNINFVLGVNIKDANDRTPIHSAFRSSTNLNTNISDSEKQLNTDTDFGNQIEEVEVWQEEYKNKILSSDHPLIYLFAKAHGNIHARDKYLLTPLHYSVAHNNLAGVKQLVRLNADIESQDRQEIRPLHLACKEGYLSIVEYLIERGSKIDAVDADGWTPLHYACAKGHLEIIRLIHSNKERNFQKMIQMKTNSSATCLHLAVQNRNIQSVQYIFAEFNDLALKILVNEQAEPFGTPLHIAAKFCDPPMLNLLYRHGADPSILNSHDQSPLHIACASNRLPVVQELFSLTQSSLLEIKDYHGRTVLSVTTNPDIIDELIAFDADISSLDNNHMNALMIAVANRQLEIVERLLFAINDQLVRIFDQVDKRSNRSIFLLAVQTGYIDMCSLLLTHPYVRWDTIDKQRMNIFHIAARNNHHELIQFLSEQIRKLDKLISMKSRSYSHEATTNSDTINIQQISSVLRQYIDAQDEDGKTPLHLAAEHGHTLSIEMLLKYGADALLTNYIGQLALHAAILNGHSQSVDVLLKACTGNMADFQSVLSRRQSPLITACQNGFVDIVRLLLSQQIGVDYGMDYEKEDNPLEIAIKYRQIETIHALLEHPHTEHWLMSVRKTKTNIHRTPLRDMIEYIPECVKHAFDKLILKTDEIDPDGNTFERNTYKYKYIDDYFMDNGKLYGANSRQLYRNHPFIIALDSEHHSLLEHPLARQLISRKWKLYRPFFYSTRILTFLLLLILTFYVLLVPAPSMKSPKRIPLPLIQESILPMRWIIVILSGLNLFEIILEIISYRGLRVPFAQFFGIISFISSILAFIPYEENTQVIVWQWQLAAFSILFQWFNIAFILRSVPFIGKVIIMFQSIFMNFVALIFVILPLLIAFTISIQMIFFNHSSFLNIINSIHKLSAMLIGEFGYETLFFAKPTFTSAAIIFVPFIFIMTIVFMNLLLGLSVGDIQSSMENATAKANAYQIRELIYIESSLLSIGWLKSNISEIEIIDHHAKDSILTKNDERNEEEEYNESLFTRQRISDLGKSLEILNMLCTQAKQVLEKEIDTEKILKQLLAARKAHGSRETISDGLNTSR